MTVNITWSENAGGSAITSVSWGNIQNGDEATAKDVYFWHDGTEKITNCQLYIQPFSGTYNGSASAQDDYNELIAWGDGASDEGFLLNQNTENGSSSYQTHNSSQGTASAPFTLSRNAVIGAGGAGTAGELDAGETAHIQVKIKVPSGEDTAGTRQFDQCLKYTYTS